MEKEMSSFFLILSAISWRYLLKSLPKSVTLDMEKHLEFSCFVRKLRCDDTEKISSSFLTFAPFFEKGGCWVNTLRPEKSF